MVTVLLGDRRLPDAVKRDGKFNEEDIETIARLKEALTKLPDYDFTFIDDHDVMMECLHAHQGELVFNLCDEGFGNDAFQEAHVPAVLDILGHHYSGAGPACLILCYDKSVTRALATQCGVPVPWEIQFMADEPVDPGRIPAFPAFIKPNHGDGSFGITEESLVHDATQADCILNHLRSRIPGLPLLVQEYLAGTEYTVGLIGNPGHDWTVLPIIEVDYSRLGGRVPILCHASKWHPDSPYWTDIGYRRAALPPEIAARLVEQSKRLFRRLECRDYARFDYRTDERGQIKLLEVNPNPGWCWDGKMNLMAQLDGLSYEGLLELILNAAMGRGA
ncbi:MAG: D-alanine--D-alanine ligase [Magnetococcales bacterium]|nr:D-alanine--D-alanine ligase [Magnetococcales bacterium]